MAFIDQNGKEQQGNVVLALDVGEPQVDIKKIRKFLQYEITHTENITTRFNSEVISIQYCPEEATYKVTTVEKGPGGEEKPVVFMSKGIVNSSWQNIEVLNKGLGLPEKHADDLMIRMKISLLAKLPPELENMDTCIFSLGPYCSITNQYDGTAVLTYEPITNVGHYFQGKCPSEKMNYIRRHRASLANTEIGQKIAQEIIDGCAVYVPSMSKAQLQEIRVGYVKMYVNSNESYSIYSKESPIHRRREDGIITHDDDHTPCYISASAMKMTYAQSNAEKIRVIMKEKMAGRAHFKPTEKSPNLCNFSNNDLLYERIHKQAEQGEDLLQLPTLLRNPVTLEYFTPTHSE